VTVQRALQQVPLLIEHLVKVKTEEILQFERPFTLGPAGRDLGRGGNGVAGRTMNQC
jgi:hypothetical protein